MNRLLWPPKSLCNNTTIVRHWLSLRLRICRIFYTLKINRFQTILQITPCPSIPITEQFKKDNSQLPNKLHSRDTNASVGSKTRSPCFSQWLGTSLNNLWHSVSETSHPFNSSLVVRSNCCLGVTSACALAAGKSALMMDTLLFFWRRWEARSATSAVLIGMAMLSASCFWSLLVLSHRPCSSSSFLIEHKMHRIIYKHFETFCVFNCYQIAALWGYSAGVIECMQYVCIDISCWISTQGS